VPVPQTFNYTLAGITLELTTTRPSAHMRWMIPRRGFRGSLSVKPTLAIGHPNATFLITQFKVATYFDLNKSLTDCRRGAACWQPVPLPASLKAPGN